MGMQATGAIADIYGRQAGVAAGAGDAAAQNAMNQGANWQNTLNNVWGFGADALGGNSIKKTSPAGRSTGFGGTGGIGAGLGGGSRWGG